MTDPKAFDDPEIHDFLLKHENSDLTALVLSGKSVADIPVAEIVAQIRSRKKAKQKLPRWYQTKGIVFPPPVSIEQASSEETATYKAELITDSDAAMLDLTGGMGVDSSYFARSVKKITYVERQAFLVECFRHNCAKMAIENCAWIAGDGVGYLAEVATDQYDVIYLDPARRDNYQNKVIALDQCEPDVSVLHPLLLEKSRSVIIKLSPMLDISHTISALSCVREVHVVAVENECKELLFVLERGFDKAPTIHTVNLQKPEDQRFSFLQEEERNANAKIGSSGSYLYEPNAAILKSGAFKVVAQQLQLSKLHEHTHLYISDSSVKGFPGKVYHIEKQYPASKKMIKTNLGTLSVSIKSRNYPESAESIRKKYRLKDGSDRYVFFTTAKSAEKEQKVVYECKKV